MSDDFRERPCENCGELITSQVFDKQVGDNHVHTYCEDEYVDGTPKMKMAPVTCEECGRSFWSEAGLGFHEERDACA